jgi:hypothetical protein
VGEVHGGTDGEERGNSECIFQVKDTNISGRELGQFNGSRGQPERRQNWPLPALAHVAIPALGMVHAVGRHRIEDWAYSIPALTLQDGAYRNGEWLFSAYTWFSRRSQPRDVVFSEWAVESQKSERKGREGGLLKGSYPSYDGRGNSRVDCRRRCSGLGADWIAYGHAPIPDDPGDYWDETANRGNEIAFGRDDQGSGEDGFEMTNRQKWAVAIGLPFAMGFAQAFEEGKALIDALRHGVHALIPALVALKMTLKQNDK